MNMDSNDKVEVIKMNLESVMKLKVNKQRELCQIRNRERSLNDELAAVKAEMDFIREQLEDVKNQIVEAKNQISIAKICSASVSSGVDAHVATLEKHRKGFQAFFDRERNLFDLRMKEVRDKEAEKEELERQKHKKITEKREHEAKEAAGIETECLALEKECIILKKRNNAIMLKLRRKLLETENARRDLTKK